MKTRYYLLILFFFTFTISTNCSNSSSEPAAETTDEGDDDTTTEPATDTEYDISLASLEITSETLSDLDPTFDSLVTEYQVEQTFLSDNTVRFVATTTDAEANLITNDGLAESGVAQSLEWDEIDNELSLIVSAPDNSSAQEYTVTLARNALAQTTHIKASNTEDLDYFGYSIAISGDTMVVGAPNENGDDLGSQDDAGAVYVYERNSENDWEFVSVLRAGNLEADDQFGHAVAIDGDTLVVGAHREDGSAQTVNGASDELASLSGAAYVFEKDASGDWLETAYLKGSNQLASDLCGQAVAIDNNSIVVGCYKDDNTAFDSGAAYVYINNGTTWEEEAYLKSDIVDVGDEFGYSVDIDADTIVIGAHYEDGSATEINGIDDDNVDFEEAGAAYIFERTGTDWLQTAYVKASDSFEQDFFGAAVAVSGDTVVVTSYLESSDTNNINGNPYSTGAGASGAAYTYVRQADTWVFESFLKAPNSGTGDYLGWSVAIDNDIIVVGAINEDSASQEIDGDLADDTSSNSGAAYVFRRDANEDWEHVAYLKPTNSGVSDQFGYAVGISGDTVVVGARTEDGSATGIDPTDDDLGLDTGAAYTFQ